MRLHMLTLVSGNQAAITVESLATRWSFYAPAKSHWPNLIPMISFLRPVLKKTFNTSAVFLQDLHATVEIKTVWVYTLDQIKDNGIKKWFWSWVLGRGWRRVNSDQREPLRPAETTRSRSITSDIIPCRRPRHHDRHHSLSSSSSSWSLSMMIPGANVLMSWGASRSIAVTTYSLSSYFAIK